MVRLPTMEINIFNEDLNATLNTTEAIVCPFEVKSLNILSNCLKVSDTTVFSATSSPLYVIVAVEKKVSIYAEESLENVWDIETSANVSCISLSEDSCLLFVAECTGKCHLFYIPSRLHLWTCDQLVGKSNVIDKAFFTTETSGSWKIFIFSPEKVYETSNICVPSLYNAIENGNFSEIVEALTVVEINLPASCPGSDILSSFQLFQKNKAVGLAFHPISPLPDDDDDDEDSFFCVEDIIDGYFEADWDYDHDNKSPSQCYDFTAYDDVKQAVCTRDGRYIVFLNFKCFLSMMCTFTHHLIKTWDENENNTGPIKSFILNETMDPSSFLITERRIGLLRMPTNSDGGYSVFEIRKFPSFEIIYSITLSSFAQLVECKPNQDCWYILNAGMSSDESGANVISNLNVKTISETLPENRLMKLVNRRKYLEAEKLAKISNLSSEIVHKTKVNCILNNMLLDKFAETEIAHMWQEVEKSLKEIKDVDFIRSCMSHSFRHRKSMKQLLICIKNWIILNKNTTNLEDLISEVNGTFTKITTHEVLFCDLNSSMSLKDFLNADLLDYMICKFKSSNLQVASIIWERHKDLIIPSLNEEKLLQIVSALPNSISSEVLTPFLCEDFLPPLFLKFPDLVDKVAEWFVHRLYLIEISEKDIWPDNGIQLVNGFIKVVEGLKETSGRGETGISACIPVSRNQKRMANPEYTIGCFYEFSKNLALISNLKSNFKCRVSLSDFEESRENVIFLVLDRVDLQMLSKAIDDFVRPYTLDNDLDLDQCLKQYIENTLQSTDFTWWSWDEDPWEERLVTVIDVIHATDTWMKTALMIIARATVPWSERIEKLVKRGMDCDHAISQDFHVQSKLVGLKEILLKYDLKAFSINQDSKQIDALLNYIFKQYRPTVLEDAKKVLSSFTDVTQECDANFKYLQFSLNQNKLDNLFGVFVSLPQDTAINCARRLLQYIKLYLDDEFLVKYEPPEKIQNMLYVGIHLIEYLQKSKQPCDEKFLSCFRNLRKLRDEFNISLSVSGLFSKSKSQELINSVIEKHLAKSVSQKSENNSVTSSEITKLNRLGDILSFERQEVVGFLITKCLEKQNYDLVLKLCKELISSCQNRDVSKTLMTVVEHFYANFEKLSDASIGPLIDTIFHLNSVAVTNCGADSLVQYTNVLQLSKYLSFIKPICGQRMLMAPPESTDIYHQWKFDPVYSDAGFQLDCNVVIRFVQDVCKAFGIFTVETDEDMVVENFETSTMSLVQHMSERSQGLAALRTLYLYYHLKMKSLNFTDIQSVSSSINGAIQTTVTSISHRAISQRKVDMDFIYNLLRNLPQDLIVNFLKGKLKPSNNFQTLAVAAKIGMELANSLHSKGMLNLFESIYKKASLLSKKNIKSVPMEMVLNIQTSEMSHSIVQNLIATQEMDIATIYECCSAFGVDTNSIFILHLNSIIADSENALEDDDRTAVLERVESIIRCIQDEKMLYDNLMNLVKKISSYNYELLLFLYEQLLNLSANVETIISGTFEKNINILKFLKVYKRTSPVTEFEVVVHQSMQGHSNLPDISSSRLPFHCFIHDKAEKIINPELNANTLPVWLKMAPLLTLSSDNLSIIAVKNSVISYLEKHLSSHVVLNSDARFINIVVDMINSITSLESRVAVASWVSNKMPPGGNKVAFAAFAVKLCEEWYRQCPESARSVCKKMVSIHQKLVIQQVLYQNNLTTAQVLELSHSPVQLIQHLIEEYSADVNKSKKACKTVAEIASIVQVDLSEILLQFILRWISETQNHGTCLDETFSGDQLMIDDNVETDEDNVVRIINLLLNFPDDVVQKFCTTLKEKFADMSSMQKSKLLLSVLAVFDTETVARQLQWDPDAMESCLTPLRCSLELEHLNLPCSVEMFTNCNKIELIQLILSSRLNNPKALIFCVQLCHEFDIWTSSIWEVILKRIVMKGNERHLQDILFAAQGNLRHMWHTETFINAWKCVIYNILKMDLVVPNDTTVLMRNLYKVLLRCPCASFLNAQDLSNELKMLLQVFDVNKSGEIKIVEDISSLILMLGKIVNIDTSTAEIEEQDQSI